MSDPKEPDCPAGRVPHHQRVHNINRLLREGQKAVIAIDNTPEHKEWYLHELKKYPSLKVEEQFAMGNGIWIIKVRKEPW